jgi:flagellar basal-body rod protein FlgC
MDLIDSLHISAAAMRAQGARMRVIAENVANADSIPLTPGAEPYRRRVALFRTVLDRELGVELVDVAGVRPDFTDFQRKYEPGHPAADAEGYVLTPNVNALIEMADMREAQRSYEANLKVIEASRAMLQRTVDLLR